MCVYVPLPYSIITCVAPLYFSKLSHKRYDFRGKKVTVYKTCVLIFSATLIQNTSHFKKNSGRYCHKYVYICLHIKYLLYMSDCNKNLYFLNRFSKNTQTSNSIKICPVGAELFHVEGRTDRMKDAKKSIVTLRNLSKAIKWAWLCGILVSHSRFGVVSATIEKWKMKIEIARSFRQVVPN